MRFNPLLSFATSLFAVFLTACAGNAPVAGVSASATMRPAPAREAAAPLPPGASLPSPPIQAPAPALPPVTEPPAPDPETNVFFATGSHAISSETRAQLTAVVEKLKARPRADITLVGHTDDTGSSELNIALAQKRVAAVASELQSMGIPSRQIRRISYGNEASGPHNCQTARCRQQERRVELRVSGSD
jgi:outer membrane protein OmpA-like peptidoglycan-associated protein